jgi:hypothetical protein
MYGVRDEVAQVDTTEQKRESDTPEHEVERLVRGAEVKRAFSPAAAEVLDYVVDLRALIVAAEPGNRLEVRGNSDCLLHVLAIRVQLEGDAREPEFVLVGAISREVAELERRRIKAQDVLDTTEHNAV